MENNKKNKITYDKAFIIDMDGVMNNGKSLISGSK